MKNGKTHPPQYHALAKGVNAYVTIFQYKQQGRFFLLPSQFVLKRAKTIKSPSIFSNIFLSIFSFLSRIIAISFVLCEAHCAYISMSLPISATDEWIHLGIQHSILSAIDSYLLPLPHLPFLDGNK